MFGMGHWEILMILMVVLLLFGETDVERCPGGVDPDAVDDVLLWSGNPQVLVAAIKLVEDSANVAHDCREGDVQVIMVVEDSVRDYSRLLSLLFANPAFSADFQKGLDAAQRGDYAAALKEWRPLAQQGGATAQFNLGTMYDKGRGVSQDYKEAMKWSCKAAEQGNASSQEFLGITIYGLGNGVPQDYVESYAWLNISAAQGSKNASDARDFIAKQLSSEALAKAQELSKEYYKKYVEPFQ